jgi:hypothetical protein
MEKSKILIGDKAYFEFLEFIIIHQHGNSHKVIITGNSVFEICLN